MSSFIIFGSGGVGIRVMELLLSEGNDVICFADNSNIKWGTACEGRRVIPPDKILEQRFDYVAIGAFKASDIIKNQLLGMGISEEKIVVPIKPDRIFPLEIFAQDKEEPDQDGQISRNTQEYLNRNIKISDEDFFSKLDDLKQVLKKNNVPLSKVCVVSGAVLQVLGLRKSKEFDDVDIVMTSDLRRIYGSGLVIVSDTAEMHVQDSYYISDDEIIKNKAYHFMFFGLKFMHPRILLEYAKNRNDSEYELLYSADLWDIE